MIAIRTKDLSPLFSDLLGFKKFIKSLPNIGLVVSPGDGKDWELSGAIPDETKVYSLIPHTEGAQETIDSHKLALGVFDIIPLFPAASDPGNLRKYSEYGIYDVQDVEEIQEFENIMEKLPDVVRISINPLRYPKELIDYCRNSGIKILGTDIFGPNHLREYYKGLFPETFMQAFGEHNTDILEIPGDDPYFIKRVYSRKGKNQEEKKFFEYTKEIDKVPSLRLPGPKVYQTMTIEIPKVGKLSIPGNKGKFTLKPVLESFDLGDPVWEDTLIPKDVDKENKELLGTLHRYHVLSELSDLHSPKMWKPIFTKIIPDFWVIKIIPKKWVGWMWKEYLYWMISGKLWEIPLSGHESLINEES